MIFLRVVLSRHTPARVLLIAAALAWTTGCGGSSSTESAAPAAQSGSPNGKRVDASTAASVSGRVIFEGTPPARARLDVSADSKCAALGRPVLDESVIVADGGLQNVFVYIKAAPAGYAFDVPAEPAKLDQDGCVYTPHVLGVRVGQPLEIGNSDPTAHNVHAAATANRSFNLGQPFQGMKSAHRFSKPEVMVPFKCDIHPWMSAYVGVVDHPYFAVSDAAGRFTIAGLPPGTYTIEAWHETLGTRSATVTVSAQETKDLSFTFKAS